MELPKYSPLEHSQDDIASASTSSQDPYLKTDSPAALHPSTGRRYLVPQVCNFFKSEAKAKPITLGLDPPPSSDFANAKAASLAALDPRPFTEFMALSFGIMGGFSVTGSSVGGIVAGAGLGLVFGLGAASVVAELYSPGKRRNGENCQEQADLREDWNAGGLELDDLGAAVKVQNQVVQDANDDSKAEAGDFSGLELNPWT